LRVFCSAAFLLIVAGGVAGADQIVYFANGKAIQVKSVESQDKFTILEMEGGGKIGVPTEQIARIEDLTVPSPAPAVLPAATASAPVAAAPAVAGPAVTAPSGVVPGQATAPVTAQATTQMQPAAPTQPGVVAPGAAGRTGTAPTAGMNRRFQPPRTGGPMLSVGSGAGGRAGMGRPGARGGARQGANRSGPRGGTVAPPNGSGAVTLPDPDPQESQAEEPAAPEGAPSAPQDPPQEDDPSTEPGQEEEDVPPQDYAPPSRP
jgi:hypothetical protein